MKRDQLLVTAYHEAGHAVLAWACDIKVSKITIVADGGGLGSTLMKLSPEQQEELAKKSPDILQRLCIAYLGGMAADYNHWQRQSGGDAREAIQGDRNDQQIVRERLEILGHSSDFDAYLMTAISRIGEPETWAVVERLAQLLVANIELDSSHFDVLAEATPAVDDKFWELLRQMRDRLSKPEQ